MATESSFDTQKLRGQSMSGASTFTEAISGALKRRYGQVPCGRKVVARIADASHRTVENWFAGRNAPKGPELIRLMAANQELEADILRLIEEIRCLSR